MLGPVNTKRRCQCCDDFAMMLAIVFSLKTMKSLQIGVATHFQMTPLFSTRTELLASSLTLGVNGPLTVVDPGRETEWAMPPPPGPVKISHKKDGRRRQLHKFHVSRSPLPGHWIRYCLNCDFDAYPDATCEPAFRLQSSSTTGIYTVDSGGLMVVRGTMACRAYLHNKSSFKDATNVRTCIVIYQWLLLTNIIGQDFTLGL